MPTLTSLRHIITRWRKPDQGVREEAPLRLELFSLEHLERHGRALAAAHRLRRPGSGVALRTRLRANAAVLNRAYAMVAEAAAADRKLTPAAEWLVDNFYLVEEQMRIARRHLPRGYARQLPCLRDGPHAGHPRVYALALELIAHVDGRVDAAGLVAFVNAYQTVVSLTLGELWAVPIMLRLALIENLRRVAVRIIRSRHQRNQAGYWVARMADVAEREPTKLILDVADLARSEPELGSAFVAEFVRQIQGRNPALSLAINWIESRLAEQGATIEQHLLAESQAQASDQVSIGHSIGSLRTLGAIDWREFVETMSAVETTLRADPADAYAVQDFATRDRYRHAIETLARRARRPEPDVAAAAVARSAQAAASGGRHTRQAHVGWWLIGDGARTFARDIRARRPLLVAIGDGALAHPLPFYLLALLGGSALAGLGVWAGLDAAGLPLWLGVVGGVIAALAASEPLLGLLNWAVTALVAPRPLPRLDFTDGLPSDRRAAVAVPALFSTPEGVDELINQLEVRWLANRDANLRFVLLSDGVDADCETAPGDDELVARAQAGISRLNHTYAVEGDLFFLLHRARRRNEREGRWMGWERKRGKLEQFNHLLLTNDAAAFSIAVGDLSRLERIPYVIALDADTQLPRDSAAKLIGTLAHPLVRPEIDPARRVVVSGHAIIQPRVAVALPSARRSWFAWLASGDPGIDPYTRAVSDVYQDLFAAGSFVGKGAYEVAAFAAVAGDRFPENRILSHDLLEGGYARAALASDIVLYEDHPARYLADSARRHRWVRGDWQVARWILPRVPGPSGRSIANPLDALARWKLFDNLRRSLLAPAWVVLLVGLACIDPLGIRLATAALALLLLPAALPVLAALITPMERFAPLMRLRNAGASALRQSAQVLLQLATLPHQALTNLDAVLRTWWRLLISRRRLLEWTTASESERRVRGDFAGVALALMPGPLLAIAAAALLAMLSPHGLLFLSPVLGLWACASLVVWLVSSPLERREPALGTARTAFLRRQCRRTWRFFEQFVGRDDHWLPPDNVQEVPVRTIAHRTSPTNIGLSLLSNLTAWDLGYLTSRHLLERCDRTLGTMERLERHRGHFLNWYDTRTLRPLPPFYVSTVDSGNLAGHLLVLRRGLAEIADAPLVDPRLFAGLRDTLAVAEEAADALRAQGGRVNAAAGEAAARLRRVLVDCATLPPSAALSAYRLGWERLHQACAAYAAGLDAAGDSEARWWGHALERHAAAAVDELAAFAPWTALPGDHGGRGDQRLRDLMLRLDRCRSLREVAALRQTLVPELDALGSADDLRGAVVAASARAAETIAVAEDLGGRCAEFADIDYAFLYDRSRDLFSIGYNVGEHRLDNSFYDLLASEARLASYLAIAANQVPQDHWFALGRMLTVAREHRTLLSWSGSMFEYLMPMLVMPSQPETLLDAACRGAVARHISFAKSHGVPWGISESGYNLTDGQLNYQYRAFGVPGLGLKRGLADDLVIAPYASQMALLVAPEAAIANLELLASQGRVGEFGFYEAIDHTASRLARGQSAAVVKSWMAHHQGMAFVAMGGVLTDRPMPRRFASDPQLKAFELLLHERVPRNVAPIYPHAAEADAARPAATPDDGGLRVVTNPNLAQPEVHLLSNGRYHVMVSIAGGGYSRWRDLAVTRWREDPTYEQGGIHCYLRDADAGDVWSTAHLPTQRSGRGYEAIFSQARVEFRRSDHGIDSHTEIAVSPEDDVELRRVTLTNRGRTARTIEVTSYLEPVLAPQAAEVAHPAFANLFVQTETLPSEHAVLCTRRPRKRDEKPPVLLHLVAVNGRSFGQTSFETDRAAFIGRGRSLADPVALERRGPLGGAQGAVLDPALAVRRMVRLEADEQAVIDIVTGVTETRDAALALIEKYREPRLADRVIELAMTNAQVVLRHLDASETLAQAFGRLAAALIHPTHHRRAPGSTIARNRRGQSALWGYGISGDLPIALMRATDPGRIDVVRQVLQAHAYWRTKGLAADLLILVDDASVYRGSLYDQVMGVIAAGHEAQLVDKPGGIFVRRGDQISEEDRTLFQAVARVVLTDADGPLIEQIDRRGRPDTHMPRLSAGRNRAEIGEPVPARDDLVMGNGHGGFTRDGREYVIQLEPGRATPAPWVNVIANDTFGTVVSETGAAYTWLENSHEYRLTPWHDDPVCDPHGEALYLRDEESGAVWSPTPGPVQGTGRYVVRHGFGYSVFEHAEGGIASETWIYVAPDAPVKLVRLVLRNRTARVRQLSATGYWEWVLGELRGKNLAGITTEIDPRSGALTARNPFNGDFPDRIAFADCSEAVRTVTGDRAEFLGRNGTAARPVALTRTRLSNRAGAGFDPCAAIMTPVTLAPGEEREVVFMLGAARDGDDLQLLIQRFRSPGAAKATLEQVWQQWNRLLGTVWVETPDPQVDVLVNGWLLYQVIACRLWGRTGFYQSGGAFGFRDQLQDVCALVGSAPWLTREQLLRAAARQFRDGDVQHWWHPPANRGVRTRISDDYLWLPYTVARYVAATGDTGVLDEMVASIDGRQVRADEEAYYDQPQISDERVTLAEHCARAIQNGLRTGPHGLPPIGCGDWNDGMNLVGEHGIGESVWLGFFLIHVIERFAPLAEARGDVRAATWREHGDRLRDALATHAWDGEWYLRAWFDDGTPLGSRSSPECQIDALPQAWATIAGVGDPARANAALAAVENRLVKRKAGLIQLFDPPFDRSALEPGYIKGYLPGVRENGGQYTHAAVWTVMAFAESGQREKAWDLFSLINPVRHGSTAAGIATYKVEPYVVTADVYGVAPHIGRGGWSWYTGSAGWMYRLILESLLGLHLEGGTRLRLAPRLRPGWGGMKATWRFGETFWRLTFTVAARGERVVRVVVDGVAQSEPVVQLADDRVEHQVSVELD